MKGAIQNARRQRQEESDFHAYWERRQQERLALARKRGLLQRNLDLEHASYFLSRITVTPTRQHGMSRWRKYLFTAMTRNAASPIEHFNLPVSRTVMVGSQIGV